VTLFHGIEPEGLALILLPALLVFVVVVPLLLEPMKLLPQVWEFIMSTLAMVGLVSR